MEYIAIIFGMFFLIKGGEYLFEGSISLSVKLNIPKFIIGMTIVSFATSAPELVVSVQSAIMGYSDLALGNIIGSNIANIAFVLGLIILISPIRVEKIFYKTDWPIMMVITILFFLLFKNDNSLSRLDGSILILVLICYLFFLLFFHKSRLISEELNEIKNNISYPKTFYYIVTGGFLLWLGSEVLINGVIDLATNFGVSERIVSLSVVAFGTSIPELTTSIVAIINKEKGISIGNLVGSNIFDMLGVMGITALISPIIVTDNSLFGDDFLWMLSFSFLILPLLFINKKLVLGRLEGVILIGLYIIFIGRLF
tara:strand:+ start:3734 stop:4669 length:936 start_codon:yes stop_codon:yes gene_type:complete